MPADRFAWLNKTKRQDSDKKDKKYAKRTGRKVTSASGSGKHKLDLSSDDEAIETKYTDKKSFRITESDIRKAWRDVSRAAGRGNRKWPVFCITMRDANNKPLTIIVISEAYYEYLRE